MSRGFHAFFRQYYNLRSVLRRTDPTLERLRPLEDYPLVRAGGAADSFARIPRTPPLNLAAFVARSPSFDLAGLPRSTSRRRWACSTSTSRRRTPRSTGSAPPRCSTGCASRSAARHLALEVFARSFFADPSEFSGPSSSRCSTLYFVGSAEGLLFDVPRDDYDSTLWAPLGSAPAPARRHGRHRARGALGRRPRRAGGGIAVLHGPPGHEEQEWLPADAVVLALDPVGLRRVVASSPGLGGDDEAGEAWREAVAGIRSAPAFAVWRLWLSGPVQPHRAPFLGTSGYGPVDNVSVLELLEGHAARWHAEHGGSVVELHAYALPEDSDESTCEARMRAELHRLYPETTGLDVVHEEWLVERDCVLVGLEPWRSRPGVRTPDPRVVLAGDAVRCDLPVALMERAATTGWLAADRVLAGWGLPGHGVWSVPMGSRLGPLATAGPPRHPLLPLGGGAAAQLVEARGVDEVVGPERVRRRPHADPRRAGRGRERRGSRTGRTSRRRPRS